MKIHLLLKKEEIDQKKMKENKVAVVFDLLLATSTISSALEFGAKEVIPVMDGKAAREESLLFAEGTFILVGEYEGKTIDGFLSPNPLDLKDRIDGKTVILSTTNGTVALKNCGGAHAVYAASLLNSESVAEYLIRNFGGETIVLVCAGSSNEFNIEDFYGAGHFIDCLARQTSEIMDLTDSAFAAFQFYQTNREKSTEILSKSRVGKMLSEAGFEKELKFVAQKSLFTSVPYLHGLKRIISV